MLTTTQTHATLFASYFEPDNDGHWYPRQSGIALVRITGDESGYRIERRRHPTTSWLVLVDATWAEFDQDAFDHWAENWPLVQA